MPVRRRLAIAAALTVAVAAPAGAAPQPSASWRATQLPLPADAATQRSSSLSNVACGNLDCVAVGMYATTGQSTRAYIDTWSNGTWTAAQAPFPAAASTSVLRGVTCASDGTCAATGQYADASQATHLWVAVRMGGAWSGAEPPVPAASSGTDDRLSGFSCANGGQCLFTGIYLDSKGRYHGFLDLLAGRVWTSTVAPLPADAGGDPHALLDAATCTSAGECVATGRYVDRAGAHQALIETFSGGSWSVIRAPRPVNVLKTNPVLVLAHITCQTTGKCVASGWYRDRKGHTRALIETLTDRWRPTRPPVPAKARESNLRDIDCTSDAYCLAVGDYRTASGQLRPLAETIDAGAWVRRAVPVPGANKTAYLSSVACAAHHGCVATGAFGGTDQGLLETTAGSWTATQAPSLAGSGNPRIVVSGAGCFLTGRCWASGTFWQGSRHDRIDALAETIHLR